MILLRTRSHFYDLLYGIGINILFAFLFFLGAGLFFITCNTLRIPSQNIFLNKTDWNRKPYQLLPFHSKYFNLFLYSEKFAQGKAVYIEILPSPQLSQSGEKGKKSFALLNQIQLSIQKKKKEDIILNYTGWGYRGFWGIHSNAPTGRYWIRLRYEFRGEKVDVRYSIKINRTKYPTFRKSQLLKFKKQSDIDKKKQKAIHDLIIRSSKKKQEMFKVMSEIKIDHIISHPLDQHYITSPFGIKRIYSRYRVRKRRRVYLKSKVSIHRGLDLRGAVGTPIYAMASGKVLIAEKMHFEGNFVLIDHGSQIFSGYMHQNEILVEEGDKVDAGEKIGYVGTTGRVTGPHLHVFFKIKGNYIDPLSIISLPIRN